MTINNKQLALPPLNIRHATQFLVNTTGGHTATNTNNDTLVYIKGFVNVTKLLAELEKWQLRRLMSEQATKRAKRILKPGDKISATMCGGAKRHFTFTHWKGSSICGKTTSDCHALSIYKLNGKPFNFGTEEPAR